MSGEMSISQAVLIRRLRLQILHYPLKITACSYLFSPFTSPLAGPSAHVRQPARRLAVFREFQLALERRTRVQDNQVACAKANAGIQQSDPAALFQICGAPSHSQPSWIGNKPSVAGVVLSLVLGRNTGHFLVAIDIGPAWYVISSLMLRLRPTSLKFPPARSVLHFNEMCTSMQSTG